MGSYDNFTEENMEKSDENIETLMCADTFQECDSLLYNGHDDTGGTNFPHCTYTLLNESPKVIEDDDVDDSLNDINNSGVIDVRNKLNMPLPDDQIIVIDDSEDDSDSDLEIIEPLMQLNQNMYGATKNSNLYKRQRMQSSYDNFTEENMEKSDENIETLMCADTFQECDSLLYNGHDDTGGTNFPHCTYTLLNESPIVIEDDDVDDSLNDINNSGVIDVRIKLNMPLPDDQIIVIDDSEDDSDSDLEIIEPLMQLNQNMYGATKNSNLYKRQKENNSLKKLKIASTATVNLPVNLEHNFTISNGIPAGCSSLKSNASSSHSLKITVQKKQMSFSPRSSNSESLKRSNSLRLSHTTAETHRSQVLRAVEKSSNKYEVSLSDKINYLIAQSDSSDDTSKKFISCKYENCGTLVEEPELLIDDLYCSLACKNQKQTVTEEEHFINETSNPTEKTTVKKQLLKTSCPEENDNSNEQVIHIFNEPSKEQNKPSLKSLLSISYPEAIDDDDDYDDNNYFYLKPLIEDEDVLKYLTVFKLRSAPIQYFDSPFPTEKNLFVVGEKLEGIDPKYEALFCVMTVSEVYGYRIKLHFDGYGSEYDFWVNANCPDLFYAGWCEMNSRILQPPYNYGNVFDWTDYLRVCQAVPAPKCNFVSTKNLNSCMNPHKFHIGGKLEALDKLTRTHTKQLIYVATVADILGNRIRIHFDGWTDEFDYWADITSTYIHPIGWCEKNGRTLLPPRYYKAKKGRKPFKWIDYLAETNSEPVPEDAFVRRPLRDFSNEMIIEVFDRVVPRLLRISKVVDVRGDELKIVYDGFDNAHAYWVEDDGPDIHPVGWSSKINHPIELPPASNTLWSCNIHGCKGYGNSSNHLKIDHIEMKDCPYEKDAWKNTIAGLSNVSDRLKTHNIVTTTTLRK